MTEPLATKNPYKGFEYLQPKPIPDERAGSSKSDPVKNFKVTITFPYIKAETGEDAIAMIKEQVKVKHGAFKAEEQDKLGGQ